MKEYIILTVVCIAWFLSGYAWGKRKASERYIEGLQDGYDNAKRVLEGYNAGALAEKNIILDILKKKTTNEERQNEDQ